MKHDIVSCNSNNTENLKQSLTQNICKGLSISFYLISGIDVVHKAIDVAITSRDPNTWRTCLIEITVSSVRCTDCLVRYFLYSYSYIRVLPN